jgi:hypothetical protein
VVAVAGGKMRAFGFYTLDLLKLLDMVTVEQIAGAKEPKITLRTDSLLSRDITNVFIFLHAAPPPDVERAARFYERRKQAADAATAWEDFIAERVAPFMSALAPEELVKLQAQLGE